LIALRQAKFGSEKRITDAELERRAVDSANFNLPKISLCFVQYRSAGNAIADSYLQVGPEPQFIDHWTKSSVAAKIKLAGICADTGANAGTLLSSSASGGKNR
jgi:hypothetical protein